MKKLEFSFKNGIDIYTEIVPYKQENEHIVFMAMNSSFSVCLKDKIEIEKKNDDGIFYIYNEKDEIKCTYTLNSPKVSVDVDIKNFWYKITEYEYFIKYDVVSDEGNSKEITLKFLN